MGLKRKQPDPTDTETGPLTIQLFGLGMTALHKVGLAGLWMTLEALERDRSAMDRIRHAGGSWDRDATSVTLRWNGQPDGFFKALFEESFKIDEKSGLIRFTAMGSPMDHPQHALVLQEALLGSFLQHGQTRKVDKAQKPTGNISVQVDDTPMILQFRKVTQYAHQNGKFSPSSSNKLAGWHFPGGAVRHVGLGQDSTALDEPPERALALRFAPVGAIYFKVSRRGGGVRPQYALVLPEIYDLKKYATAHAVFLQYGTQQLYVSGTAEAGFRVLAELHAAGLLLDIGSAFCRVISFGIVPWSKQQKSRVDLFTVRAGSQQALTTFNLCRQFFGIKFVKPEKGDPFWDVPQVPDLVARNLSEGRDWWEGFAEFVADKARRNHVFRYERGGLADMTTNAKAFPDGPARTFIMACHEAWRRRLGQLGERARREGASFPDLTRREFERLRVAFSQCRNASSLRAAVADFWARAGSSLPPLQSGWGDVLPLLDEKNWKRAKDLALLALASYKPATKEEKEALESSDPAETEEEES